MQVEEISEDQLLRVIRAEYQRMETRLHQAEKTLKAILWQHGPLAINLNDVPVDLVVNTKQQARRQVLSVMLPLRAKACL